MIMCPECYCDNNCATPLLNKRDCLEKHTQYICSTCGRYICIEIDKKRNLQRWNFPFKSLEIAKLYLRTADYTTKSSCGIYEIISSTNRKSYKIFPTIDDFLDYLHKTKKSSIKYTASFQMKTFQSFPKTEIRKLTIKEVNEYLK